MKGRKKGAAVMAILLLIPSLAGCSYHGNTNSSSHLKKANITIFQYNRKAEDALQEAIQTYKKANPQIQIELETLDEEGDYPSQLKEKMESGQEPTVFQIDGLTDVMNEKDKLLDLSDQPWINRVMPGVLDGVTAEGKVYGLPFSIEGYGIMVNREIFESAGIDIDSMRTYDGLQRGFAALQEAIRNGSLKEKYPRLEAVTEFPAKEERFSGLYVSNMALAEELGSAYEVFQAKAISFQNAAAYKDLIDLLANYSAYAQEKDKLSEVSYKDQLGGGMAIERVAAIFGGSEAAREIAETDSSVLNKLILLPVPLHHLKEDSIIAGAPSYWSVSQTASKEQQAAAKDFLNWLYQSEEGKKIWAEEADFLLPFSNEEEFLPANSVCREMREYLKNGKTAPFIYQEYPKSWGEKTLGAQIQQYLSGQSWEITMQNAVHSWETLRKSY